MMSEDLWYATSAEGRTVKYAYKELSDGIAAISATTEGCSLMILQRSIRAPMTRTEVEAVFAESFWVLQTTARSPDGLLGSRRVESPC